MNTNANASLPTDKRTLVASLLLNLSPVFAREHRDATEMMDFIKIIVDRHDEVADAKPADTAQAANVGAQEAATTAPKERAYNEKIKPLMDQLMAACADEGINVLAMCALDSDDEGETRAGIVHGGFGIKDLIAMRMLGLNV